MKKRCRARTRRPESELAVGLGLLRVGLQIPMTLRGHGDDATRTFACVPRAHERRDDGRRFESQSVAVGTAAQTVELVVGQARRRFRKTRCRPRTASRQRALLRGPGRDDLVGARRCRHSRVPLVVDSIDQSGAPQRKSRRAPRDLDQVRERNAQEIAGIADNASCFRARRSALALRERTKRKLRRNQHVRNFAHTLSPVRVGRVMRVVRQRFRPAQPLYQPWRDAFANRHFKRRCQVGAFYVSTGAAQRVPATTLQKKFPPDAHRAVALQLFRPSPTSEFTPVRDDLHTCAGTNVGNYF